MRAKRVVTVPLQPYFGFHWQEDVNGEKRTVKNGGFLAPIFVSRIFGADFFTVYADFSRFIRDINGESLKKNISRYWWYFSRLVFHGLPSRKKLESGKRKIMGCSLFLAYSWKLPAYSGVFLLTNDTFGCFTYSWKGAFCLQFYFLLTIGAFLLSKCVL